MGKTATQIEYARRIGKALEFIHQHLDQVIRLEDVAAASCFSPYHFHRIFHAVVGETVNDYVHRKRMERAARRLVYKPALPVTEVAAAGGFSSGANFARAFRSYFGLSPTQVRKPLHSENSKIGKLYRKYGKAFSPRELYSQFVTESGTFDPDKLEELLMKVEVRDLQEKRVAYLTAPKGYELDSIYATWDKIVRWAGARGIDTGRQARFAICHDNPLITPEARCRYDAAIVIGPQEDVPSPYRQGVIPGGKYLVAYYKGVAEKISHFMTELCSHWFPSSGFEPDDFPAVFNYRNDTQRDAFVEMDVYIKLKALGAT